MWDWQQKLIPQSKIYLYDTYSASNKQSYAVGCGVVCQPDLDAIAGKLVSISSANDHVSLNLGVRYLTGDVLVGKADDQPVFGGVVLVLVLGNQAFAGVKVSFTL